MLLKNKSLAISCCSLIVSVISICISLFRSDYITIEWASFLIGVLSLLVTVLAIYLAVNYIYFEKRVCETINNKTDGIRSEMNKEMQLLDHTITGISITVDTIHGNYYRNEIEIALERFMIALNELSQSKHDYGIDLTMQYLYGIKLQEEKSKYPMLDITKEEKEKYVNILMRIKHKYTLDIIGFINNIKEK